RSQATMDRLGAGDDQLRPMNSRLSTTRLEKPHSLSYQATTFTCLPATRVSAASNIDDADWPVMSDETTGSVSYSRMPLSSPSAVFLWASSALFMVIGR